MDPATWIAAVSIITAGLTIAIGSIGPALAEGRAAAQALQALAQQPDASNTVHGSGATGYRRLNTCRSTGSPLSRRSRTS